MESKSWSTVALYFINYEVHKLWISIAIVNYGYGELEGFQRRGSNSSTLCVFRNKWPLISVSLHIWSILSLSSYKLAFPVYFICFSTWDPKSNHLRMGGLILESIWLYNFRTYLPLLSLGWYPSVVRLRTIISHAKMMPNGSKSSCL